MRQLYVCNVATKVGQPALPVQKLKFGRPEGSVPIQNYAPGPACDPEYARLILAMTSHKANVFAAAELGGKPFGELQALAALVTGNQQAPLPIPSWDFGRK